MVKLTSENSWLHDNLSFGEDVKKTRERAERSLVAILTLMLNVGKPVRARSSHGMESWPFDEKVQGDVALQRRCALRVIPAYRTMLTEA